MIFEIFLNLSSGVLVSRKVNTVKFRFYAVSATILCTLCTLHRGCNFDASQYEKEITFFFCFFKYHTLNMTLKYLAIRCPELRLVVLRIGVVFVNSLDQNYCQWVYPETHKDLKRVTRICRF